MDLFDEIERGRTWREELCDGAVVLRGHALAIEAGLLGAIDEVIAQAPLRHMTTPGGFRMSVAMTSCGRYGWVTDRSGYRYDAVDPDSGKRWPQMPGVFFKLAQEAALAAGFADFVPDACLINCYEPGARMSLHQDKDEHDFRQPIVSVSLGIPAVFQFGGDRREDKAMRIPLQHGDVVVWGGAARLRYHGVLALKPATHPLLGARRINLTFRKAS
ncbi:DNA oxidative demethylase AlkB [Herminiimonas glaciei]|uniref:DNA oxidative demethylase AlkB n=1 Tax=Herminiimonas glaciei TaxID=523788 RepID=A0ABW2I8J4_9BURK